MNKLKHFIFGIILGLMLIPVQQCFSQDAIQKDSSNVSITYFKDHIKERYSGNDFNYSINDTGGVNLIQRVLSNFFGWLNDVFGVDIGFVNYQILEYIIYGLLGIGALYLLINFLIQSPISSVFKTEVKDIDGFKYVEENLKVINFDKFISEAVKEKNYRLAIRFLYLKSLKELTNNNIIEWHYDKTNSDYLNEIKDQTTKSLFKRVSYIYDYVWYGDFPIDKTIYEKHQSNFSELNNTLDNG